MHFHPARNISEALSVHLAKIELPLNDAKLRMSIVGGSRRHSIGGLKRDQLPV
jgi:hypothetical protein